MVHIKGSDHSVRARQLLTIAEYQLDRRNESVLVGRTWELNTVTAILDEAINGAGCVVNIMGPPGIGKSRLVREAAAIAAGRGVEVITTHCESHTRDVPFHVLSRLLRAVTGISDLYADAARTRIRDQFRDAHPEDLVLLDDLLGIRDPVVALPDVAADARRRRLTALINSASLQRDEPAMYVIEDAHWIDEASESMLADFLTVIPHTPSITLITHRPEYRGALTRVSGAQTIALRPLNDAQAEELTKGLLGADQTVAPLATTIAQRAAGNPFFAEEMVRDLAERGVLQGDPGAYQLRSDVADASVPATLQATIGARIDRLDATAKRTLNAAAVIGAVFDADSLTALDDSVDVAPLIEAELVDQVRYSPRAEYAFRHPLIRSVAYESQLKSHRAQLHRRLAATIEQRDPESADENAALIAEHFEAAGDLHAAFNWHMRAGSWLNNRENVAALTSWRRAQRVADRLADDDPDKLAMRIASRTLLCATGFRVGGSGFESGFDQLRDLCLVAGDQRSLAIGMAGRVMELFFNARRRDASRLAAEHVELLESIGDPMLTLALLPTVISAKHETAEMSDVLRLAQRGIDLAGGDATKGGELATSSPLTMALAYRGCGRWGFGITGWREDFSQAIALAQTGEAVLRGGAMYYTHVVAVMHGVVLPSAAAVREATETLALAEQTGEDVALGLARSNLGYFLVCVGGDSRDRGLELLALARELTMRRRYAMSGLPIMDVMAARVHTELGNLDTAIDLSRAALDEVLEGGGTLWAPVAANVLVEALVTRGANGDLDHAQTAVDRLAAVPIEPGLVLYDIWLLRLRALLAHARGDDVSYRGFADRYRKMATDLGFEGHMAMAEAMR